MPSPSFTKVLQSTMVLPSARTRSWVSERKSTVIFKALVASVMVAVVAVDFLEGSMKAKARLPLVAVLLSTSSQEPRPSLK